MKNIHSCASAAYCREPVCSLTVLRNMLQSVNDQIIQAQGLRKILLLW